MRFQSQPVQPKRLLDQHLSVIILRHSGGNEVSKNKCLVMSILLTLLMTVCAAGIQAGETMTIVGVITEDGLIVDKSGVIYEIGENEKFEAVTEHTDVKIEVTGLVESDEGGNKIIMVESFKVLE